MFAKNELIFIQTNNLVALFQRELLRESLLPSIHGRGRPMAIIATGIDLAKRVFAARC